MRMLIPGLIASLTLLLGNARPAQAGFVNFDYTGALQQYTVTDTGTYQITVDGAQGGSSSANNGYAGGLGAEVIGTVFLTQGTVLDIVVGGQGLSADAGGGGGGSFVYITPGHQLLLAAGGGGGAGSNYAGGDGQSTTDGQNARFPDGGAGGTGGLGGGGGTYNSGGNGSNFEAFDGGGGGGWAGNGTSGYGYALNNSYGFDSGGGGSDRAGSFAGGGAGSSFYGAAGGYGGGGGSGDFGGGGGGGYSGGGGGAGNNDGSAFGGGGGGGSYVDSSVTDTTLVSGFRSGNGHVKITELDSGLAVPEPASLTLLGIGIACLVGYTWRRRNLAQPVA